jgi:hypothetical protein
VEYDVAAKEAVGESVNIIPENSDAADSTESQRIDLRLFFAKLAPPSKMQSFALLFSSLLD